MQMNLLKLFKTTIKYDSRNYSTKNGNIIENDLHFPYKFKADFFLSYQQYMCQYVSFYLDLYSRKLPDHSYLLVVTVNNVVITTHKLVDIKKSCEFVTNAISYDCSKSSTIKFTLMHCFIWEEKCPYNIMKFLRSTKAKGSLVRSKLKNYFHKFKPVPGPFGL